MMILLILPLAAESAEENLLYKKLIDGSPWLFTTKYENTQWSFHLGPEGELQRQGSDGSWKDMIVIDSGVTYKTNNGHQITFRLNENGTPVAIHSKHSSTFTSIKQ